MKIKVIINPKTRIATSRRLDDVLMARLDGHLTGIERTSRPREATAIASRCVQEGIDTIVAVGGDGTVNEIINGIIGSDVALGVIPGGTANDLGAWHRIPRRLEEACRTIRRRHVRAIDVIRVNGCHHLVTAGGIGLIGDITRIANTMKRARRPRRFPGSRLYNLAALRAVLRKARRHRVRIQWPGNSLVTRPLSLLIANQPLVGGRFQVAPGARNDDGLLDVCLIESTAGRRGALEMVGRALRGTLDRSPGVRLWRASEVFIAVEPPMTFVGDGESLERATEFRIGVLPRALKLIVPRGTAREGANER